MNKKEKEQLLQNYKNYYFAFKNEIVTKEIQPATRSMLFGPISNKDITAIENDVEWQDYPVILNRFKMIHEIIEPKMSNYVFEYNIDSLEMIKDECPFFAESEKQANAIIELINDLINRINTTIK